MTERAEGLAVVVGAGGGIGAALLRELWAQRRYEGLAGLGRNRPADWPTEAGWTFVETDITDEAQIARAAEVVSALGRPTRVLVATGVLHGQGIEPEKTMRALDAAVLQQLFLVNAVGPALVAKHFLPLIPRDRPSVFAALSARVGSLSDNRLGGWYGYRASKAALNMFIATLAVEHRRTHPLGICAALHPGTVETGLSAAFPARSPVAGRLSPAESARALLQVVDGLQPSDSGRFFAWDGKPIAW
ncbi:SDR family NAD(P)-dependent oxidoreductase [Brevundimonas sp. SL130]|uniref:SDR family NAD(P)-dependent oxidoreductase n=1 Tax=Brevundimonas sp. SL130 TaxID=2995143 RepID=UPI00226D386F|nr:SDR family NAD(P)-dependent oxidoreductase [Brevundimonas sp. SL130]WAC59605.1 SDR family NAD(P)-dependent oxidoreductase [Brevundimonas sp. SL130]